jgi:hypothetical protein
MAIPGGMPRYADRSGRSKQRPYKMLWKNRADKSVGPTEERGRGKDRPSPSYQLKLAIPC